MYKKIFTLFGILSLSACTSELMETRISYSQEGENCIYIEKAGDKILNGNGDEVGFNTIVSKTITYPNKKCSEIVDSDLKNGINKNHSVSYSNAMQILSSK
ncbi:MAG: hypothetical protein MJ250_02430 [Alphaproteobacteria bacterium]|nr:hypothetical protein [Alphaproteobacteria bacterium]